MPLRSVVSLLGTTEYLLAKFLDSIIKRFILDTYLPKSTEHSIEEIKKCNFSKSKQLLVLMLCRCLQMCHSVKQLN